MSESYSVYWSRARVNALKRLPEDSPPFAVFFGGPHISQPSFIRAGAEAGDWLYPISVDRGRLQILGKMKIRQIDAAVDVVPAEFSTSPDSRNERWIAKSGWSAEVFYTALCVSCTEEVVQGESGAGPFLDLYLDEGGIRNLRFRNKHGERVPKGIENGSISSPLAVQGVYRLAQPSARDFEAALERRISLT